MLVLEFEAGGQRYAIDALRVAEVVPRVPLRAVPLAPAHVAGLCHYRGRVVPVVDLGVLFGGPPAADRLGTRVVLVRPRDGELLGVLAERVSDVTRVPDAGPAEPAGFLGPVVEAGGRLVQLIEVGRLPAGGEG